MLSSVVHIADIIIWCAMAFSVGYILFFAIISTLRKREVQTVHAGKDPLSRFLVIYPAYHEDRVIVNSVNKFLQQTYSKDHYDLVVVSDHQSESTNHILSQLPITLLRPVFERSSKAQALQYAISNMGEEYDYVVILDADNIVTPDYLHRLGMVCSQGHQAIQCHRQAKNSDNEISQLDGISEEINNSIFRKAHNTIGLSSALIGSGMCFSYRWFADNVFQLSTAGEDREIEKLLLEQGIFIKYVEDIPVFDEKVGCEENFQRQRQRWMSAQLQSLISMASGLPSAILSFNVNYIDKTIQQMLIPRSMLIVGTFAISIIVSIISIAWSVKWWTLTLLTAIAIFLAIPPRMRSGSLCRLLTYMPRLTWKMLKTLRHIDSKNREFLHTTHK